MDNNNRTYCSNWNMRTSVDFL